MIYLGEMSIRQRKDLTKEELRYCLNRELKRESHYFSIKYEPVSEERLELVYNNIQNEPDDEDEPPYIQFYKKDGEWVSY